MNERLLAVTAELTHRCPLACPYCSNPLALARKRDEMAGGDWARVIREAASMGCLHIHFSGGEPLARGDLDDLVEAAAEAGLYSNLITSGIGLNDTRAGQLKAAGLDHVQVSFQDSVPRSNDRIAGLKGAFARKIEAAEAAHAAGLALTINAVVHRANVEHVPEMIDLAIALGAERIEIAHVQYYGWAAENHAALLPTRAQLDRATQDVEAARMAHDGALVIDYVVPDFHAARPKACMGGWGRRQMVISPAGRALPCHAAETIPDLGFDDVRTKPLAEIWERGEAFRRFRGTAWMTEPCRSCERREVDWGGCRCQALALAGDAGATDPACELAPTHDRVLALVARATDHPSADYRYRSFSSAVT